jgi:hypothetical protein
MNDLFSYVPSRKVDTSMAAAEKMSYSAHYWEEKVMEALRDKSMTTEELVKYIGGKDRNIQPATSRLRGKGKIRASGIKRENENGNECHVWVIA